MLCIMPAYIMLLVALFNAVCLHNAPSFLPFTFSNAFCFHALSWFIETVCLFHILYCIIHSAFNLLVFLILLSHGFFINERAMCSLEK